MKTLAFLILTGAAAAHADLDDAVFAAFDAMNEKKTYRVTTITQEHGKFIETWTAVKLPDTFHIESPNSETIVTSSDTWKRTDGEWIWLPVDASAMFKNYIFEAMNRGPDTLKDVQAIGDETLLGCVARKYRYRAEAEFMGSIVESTQELFVCRNTGLPIRVVITDATGEYRGESRYDFETPVSIQAPN